MTVTAGVMSWRSRELLGQVRLVAQLYTADARCTGGSSTAGASGVTQPAAVASLSGAPYALAAAYRLPERVNAVGLASGLAGWLAGPGAVRDVRPEFRTFATWCHRLRPAARAFVAFQARGFRGDPEGTIRKEAATTGGNDDAVAGDSAISAMLVASAHEVWDRGGEGTYEHSAGGDPALGLRSCGREAARRDLAWDR